MRTISKPDHPENAKGFRNLILELGRRMPFRDPLVEGLKDAFTPAQFHLIIWLGHDGALTMGELARRLCVTEKTITGVVDRLVAGAYVKRERSEHDRRVVHARLTKKGEQIFKQMDEHFCDRVRRFLAALDLSDRKDLFRIFTKLLERLRAHEGAQKSS